MYNSDDGGLLIAYLNGQAVGVASLRRLDEKHGELKRDPLVAAVAMNCLHCRIFY